VALARGDEPAQPEERDARRERAGDGSRERERACCGDDRDGEEAREEIDDVHEGEQATLRIDE